MSFNQHIGIYQTEQEFLEKWQYLEEPWVAYIIVPEDGKPNLRYPGNINVRDDSGDVNVLDYIKETLPVLCTEEEYEYLLTYGEGDITNPRKPEEKIHVRYNPNLYYYTYDASELE